MVGKSRFKPHAFFVEKVMNLFLLNCEYSRLLLLKVTEFLYQAIWKITNSQLPTFTCPDLRLSNITEAFATTRNGCGSSDQLSHQ